ncbi:hypothetical protein BaRGS_00008705 [Batillaria attramentaria]|uniref:Uncharacterized protein n=1 Tax=Batillaria attramentaria TaxID=370345 RepID=A0ABD0LLU0_9CAEN
MDAGGNENFQKRVERWFFWRHVTLYRAKSLRDSSREEGKVLSLMETGLMSRYIASDDRIRIIGPKDVKKRLLRLPTECDLSFAKKSPEDSFLLGDFQPKRFRPIVRRSFTFWQRLVRWRNSYGH